MGQFGAWADELEGGGETQQPKSQFSSWTAELEGKKLDPRGRPYDPRFAPDDEPPDRIGKAAAGFDKIVAEFPKTDAERAAAKEKLDAQGFFARAFESAAQGAAAVKKVGGEVIETKGAVLADPQKRRQLLRGVDDIVTLGYGQKFAARIGNALGDQNIRDDEGRPVALGPETFGSAFASAGAPIEHTRDTDQAAAPEYRSAGHVLGSFAGGASASRLIGQGAGKAVRAIAPAAKGVLPGAVAGTAESLLGYGAASTASAALSAEAEGRRLEAAKEAATDPLGILVAGATGGVGGAGRAAVMGSKGAKARQVIEEHGQGATVSPFSAGRGGVFSRELAGVELTDRGIGQAAKIGAQQIADTIEQQFKDQHGFGYREGPKVIKEAQNATRERAKAAKEMARSAELRYRDDISAAKEAVRTETAERARAILDNIEEEHRTETSIPYRKLKAEIDGSEAAAKLRDVSPIVDSMRAAVNELETAPMVRGQLEQQLSILENYRTKRFNPGVPVEGPRWREGTKAGDAVTLLERALEERKAQGAQTDDLVAELSRIREAASTPDGPILVPERQLNGLRRTLMRSAKIGMSDAPGEAEAPLRRAAFVAKQMVDEGPYKELNDLYAAGASKREAARKAVGLKGKPAKDAAADEKRLTSNLRKLVDDDTAIPDGGRPPEADVELFRAALKAPTARRDAEMAKVRAELSAAEKSRQDTVNRVHGAAKGAAEDRALLGLNEKIGTRKTDVNQIRLALQRQGENTGTAGGSAGSEQALAGYIAKHPEAVKSAMLPELQRAKADLSFRLRPGHGGLQERGTLGDAPSTAAAVVGALKMPFVALPALAAINRAPIAGRLLYPAAQRITPGNVGGRVGATTGAAPSPQEVALAQMVQAGIAAGLPADEAIRRARAALSAQTAPASFP